VDQISGCLNTVNFMNRIRALGIRGDKSIKIHYF
jgi:hypothetical protein